ncbi:MAG: hypothetical protein IJ315_09210 [Firmicutes bacterium]|nr:hypothetical protein [Bacillota bacterium]
MRRYIIWMIILVMLTGMTGCGTDENSRTELLEPAGAQVRSVKVVRKDISERKIYHGEVVPYVEELAFSVDGALGEISVHLGDSVVKGDILVRLAMEQERIELASLEDEIAYILQMGEFSDGQLENQIKIAQIQLRILKAENASAEQIGEKELQIRKLEQELTQNQEIRSLELKYKQDRLAALKEQIESAVITAPFSGKVVYIKEAKQGDWITGNTTIICIADEKQLSIKTDFISKGIMSGVEEIWATIGENKYSLTYVPYESSELLAANLAGVSLRSEFTVDDGTENLECGQYVLITVVKKTSKNALVIPQNAVFSEGGEQYVYRIVDGQREYCSIKIGVQSAVEYEVIEGIQEGDVIYVQE